MLIAVVWVGPPQEELGCLLPRPGATLCLEQLSISSAGPQPKKGLQDPPADLHWILHAATLSRGSTDNASSSQDIYENWHVRETGSMVEF